MAPADEQPLEGGDEVRREPGLFYDNPEAVAADDSLSTEQKHRFLADWAREIEERLAGPGESAEAEDAARQLLADVRAVLAELGGRKR